MSVSLETVKRSLWLLFVFMNSSWSHRSQFVLVLHFTSSFFLPTIGFTDIYRLQAQ
jgi:hypothetical protein